MSRLQSIRRLSLMAGSSLAVAGLSTTLTVGAALAPTAAAAQAVCSAAPTSGGGTSSVTYDAGTYDPGITCAAGGDMTVTTTGEITVSTTGGVPGDPLVNGVNLVADGAESITWDSTAGTVSGGDETNGPIIDAVSDSGSITIDTAGVFNVGSAVLEGIRAISNGGGDVTVNTEGFIYAPGATGVEARSTGGNGAVAVNIGTEVGSGLYGVRAQASGTGTLTITGSVSTHYTDGSEVAAIEATTGTGLLTITGAARGRIGTGMLIQAGGDVVINNSQSIGGLAWAIDANVTSGRTITVNNTGEILGEQSDGSDDLYWRNAMRVQGGGSVVIQSSGRLQGRLDLASAGAAEINILDGGKWRQGGNTSILSGQGDTLDVAEGGMLVSRRSFNDTGVASIDFGAGTDVFTSAGTILVGTELRLLNLETFNNSGTIMLGSMGGEDTSQGADNQTNDLLAMPGVDYIGDDAVIVLDVNLAGAQGACSSSLRTGGATGALPAADCIDIAGGSTAGTTSLRINDTFPNDRGGYNPDGIVVVDVGGGTSADEHFTLDPGSDSYSAANGGIVDKGYFLYALIYDDADQQHRLVGLPGASAMQAPLLAQAVHGLWRISTGSWLDRQADLRGDLDGVGGGWLRISGESADRDAIQTQGAGTSTLTFDNAFNQSSYTVTGGVDLMRGGEGGTAYVLGVMAGYANSEIDFDASPNTAQMDGWTGGVYASLIAGNFFVDAAVSANKLILKYDVPALGLLPAGTILDTDLVSVGAQVEAGWRIALTDTAFVEPLASVSYVRTKYDDMEIAARDPSRAGLTVEFDDPASLRAGLGARVGMDQDFGTVRAQVSLLGRVWNEFEDETAAVIHNPGADAVVANEFSGQFTELGLTGSIYAGAVSGFANVGGRFGDDYQATTATAGVRVAW